MDQTYRGRLLRGAMLRGTPQVGVFVGVKRLHIADGETLDDAFAKARAFVDAGFAETSRMRRLPNIATTEEYVNYFAGHRLSEHHEKMLRANAVKPMTAHELAEVAGWDSYITANRQYGGLGKEVGREIGLTFETYQNGREFFMSALVKDLAGTDDEAGHIFEMHPELVAAVKVLGLI